MSLKERNANAERKGATKIEQNKQNENAKGVDRGQNKKHGILKGKTQEKRKTKTRQMKGL